LFWFDNPEDIASKLCRLINLVQYVPLGHVVEMEDRRIRVEQVGKADKGQ
jgi:hypothetical protein